MLSSIGVVTDMAFWGGLMLDLLDTAEALLLPLDPLLDPKNKRPGRRVKNDCEKSAKIIEQ